MIQQKVRVIVVDDHPLVRAAIESTIDENHLIMLAGSASSPAELFHLLERTPCEVVVTDYAMPGGESVDGLPMLVALHDQFPSVRIVVVTGLDQPSMVNLMLASGIKNIVSKRDSIQEVVRAVISAASERSYLSSSISCLLEQKRGEIARPLSSREKEVLMLYIGGASINDIATKLNRKKQTVSTQKVAAMNKLGISNDAELFRFASELGLTEDHSAES